jgi:tetratricopeptide (TPR) repeat protein
MKNRYGHIFFIDASTTATIRGDLESAIRSMNGHEQDTYEGALMLLSKPPESGDWLYILDNADDPNLDLTPYLPSCSHGTIIITSRNRRIGFLATTHHLELGQMQEQEAVETLCLAARKAIPLDKYESTQAIDLVKTLGFLALAIVQAGIYIYEMSSGRGEGFSFSQYSSLHEHHRNRLLCRKSPPSLDRYPYGVYATLDISYTRIPESCREFLHLCSFLRHTNIPVSIFSSASQVNFDDAWELAPRPLNYQFVQARLRQLFRRNGEWDELGFHEVVQNLSSFSLLSISSVHNTPLLRLHPLIHSHARDKLTVIELPIYRQMAITCISTAYAKVPLQSLQFVLPHCILVEEEGGGDVVHINDMVQIGRLMYRQGSYWQAEKMFRRVANVLEVVQGRHVKDTNSVFSRLASTFRKQGKWNEAEALQREVLSTYQNILGPEHLDTIRASAHLAATFRHQGKWNEAEMLGREALAMYQKILGIEHPDTINASSNLACTFRYEGKWSEAEILDREVLIMRQKILGMEHPDTILASRSLASSLYKQGKWEEAEVLGKEVLPLYRKVFGLEHPDTIQASATLAATFRQQGAWDEAEALEREVLAMRQRILGPEHPSSIHSLHKLATTLGATNRWEEALPLILQATQLAEKFLGLRHHYTILYLKQLKLSYESLGRHEEAASVRGKLNLRGADDDVHNRE